MNDSGHSGTIRIEELLWRRVYDAADKKLGRVYDFVAERQGDDLRVATLLVGHRAWLSRFGWSMKPHGREVHWEQIGQLAPVIRLRENRERGD